MGIRFADQEIISLLQERKALPDHYKNRIELRQKRGHKERELDVKGVHGNVFRIILRQSSFNSIDFSVILTVCPPNTNQVFRLRRYNGKSHQHTNQIEGNSFYDFHIHMATERYQDLGLKEDAYAEPTGRYGDYNGAFRTMLEDCGLEVPSDGQLPLFEEVDR